MMFDESQLWMADINQNGQLENSKPVLNKKAVSVFQPQWSPASILYFVADQTGWWNIYRYQNKIEPIPMVDENLPPIKIKNINNEKKIKG